MSQYGKPRTKLVCGPSRTKQSFKDQVNVNKIVERHRQTGMIAHLNARTPFYGDVSNLAPYQDALNLVNQAHELFNAMSATVRERFSNDPSRMIAFLQDPRNREEAEKLGMVNKRPTEPDKPAKPAGGDSTPAAPNS